jgi:MYXO-CTERM domain-containing protein
MKALLPAVALTAAAFTGVSAHAGSTTWLNGHDGLATSHSYTTSDGVAITATATAHDKSSDQHELAYVGQYGSGLGVSNSTYYVNTQWGPRQRTYDGSHQIDGQGKDDTLWLSFDQGFEVLGAWFSYADWNDDVQVIDEDRNVLGSFGLTPWFSYDYLDLSGLNFIGTKIGFSALDNNDNFKLKGIKGHGAQAVPTPSAAAAGLLGLAALTARRRRRDETAAA